MSRVSRQRGLSLVETLLYVAVLGSILGTGTYIYRDMRQQQAYDAVVNRILVLLETEDRLTAVDVNYQHVDMRTWLGSLSGGGGEPLETTWVGFEAVDDGDLPHLGSSNEFFRATRVARRFGDIVLTVDGSRFYTRGRMLVQLSMQTFDDPACGEIVRRLVQIGGFVNFAGQYLDRHSRVADLSCADGSQLYWGPYAERHYP